MGFKIGNKHRFAENKFSDWTHTNNCGNSKWSASSDRFFINKSQVSIPEGQCCTIHKKEMRHKARLFFNDLRDVGMIVNDLFRILKSEQLPLLFFSRY